MLGGFGHISDADIQGSHSFLSDLNFGRERAIGQNTTFEILDLTFSLHPRYWRWNWPHHQAAVGTFEI